MLIKVINSNVDKWHLPTSKEGKDG